MRTAAPLLPARVVHLAQHVAQIDRASVAHEGAGQHRFDAQQAALVQLPDLVAVVRTQQFGCKLAEEVAQVLHVAQQHALGVVVARGIHRLRQVDDHRAVFGQQHVELRQVAVHDARAQHAHHLFQQAGVVPHRLLGRKGHVVQPRRGVAVGVGHQVHQQHAFQEVVRHGHPHAGRRQAVERIDLGALPDGLGHLAAEARALGHRARLARVAHAAVLGVVDGLAESCACRLPCRPWRSAFRRRSAPRKPWLPCRSSAGVPPCRSGPRRSATAVVVVLSLIPLRRFQRTGREEGPQAFRADLVDRIMPVRESGFPSAISFRTPFQRAAGCFHVAITEIPFARGLYLDAVAELIARTCPNKQKRFEASPTHFNALNKGNPNDRFQTSLRRRIGPGDRRWCCPCRNL
jgi:hypothetical protein